MSPITLSAVNLYNISIQMITSETKMDDDGDVDIDNNINNNNNHEDIKF